MPQYSPWLQGHARKGVYLQGHVLFDAFCTKPGHWCGPWGQIRWLPPAQVGAPSVRRHSTQIVEAAVILMGQLGSIITIEPSSTGLRALCSKI